MGFFKNFVKNLTKPEVLIGAAVSTAVGGPIGGYSYYTTYAIHAGTTAALATASQELNKPDIPDFSNFNIESTGRLQTIKQAIASRRMIYGEMRVGGVLAHVESVDNDKFLHLVVMLASHEVEAIDTIYLDDTAVTLDTTYGSSGAGAGGFVNAGKYKDKVRVRKYLGTFEQGADNTLYDVSSVWTQSHRLTGISYLSVRLEFDSDVFANGIPNITAIVRGKKVYDPRTSTTAYSSNPALCIRDYLVDSKYGFGASSDEIDDTAFTTAANICDEDITLSGSGTENRYELHGTVDVSKMPKSILEDMLTSCGGVLTYQNGKFAVKAAKYVSPTLTLDEDHLRAPISLQTRRSRRDNYNAVKGVFSSPDVNYVPADYPAFKSNTFATEDGGDTVFLDLDLPYTSSSSMAQRLAKIALFRNRQQLTLTMPCNLHGFDLKVGDTVSVTNTRLGFSSKVFEVIQWELVSGDELGVDLVLRELASTVYDWDAEESAFQTDNTTLPDPFDLPAAGLSVTDELQVFNQKAVSVLIANVSSSSQYAYQFEVQAKKSADDDFISLGVSSSNKFELIDVEDGVDYDVRARIISTFGTRSPFTTVTHQVVGKTAPPEDVTDFSINIIGSEAHLSWTPVGDLDLSHYRVRHSPRTTGALFSNSTDLVTKISRPANTAVVPARTGTYFIVAVDKLGNQSNNPTSSVAIISDVPETSKYKRVATRTEHTAFTGTKSNVVAIDDALVLDTSVNFDSITGNFDDANGRFDGGSGNVATSGTYDFASYVDFGARYTGRVNARIVADRIDYVNAFDDAVGNFDDRVGLFDGEAAVFGNTDAQLYISTTDDDPSGSPTWSDYQKFVVGDYTARAVRFRAELTTEDTEATPQITELQAFVDMPDQVFADNDIASGTGSKAITFASAMYELEGVGISAQNLSSGDYYAITNKSGTGFTITFYNSSDTIVDRTFDYVAKGYGQLVA